MVDNYVPFGVAKLSFNTSAACNRKRRQSQKGRSVTFKFFDGSHGGVKTPSYARCQGAGSPYSYVPVTPAIIMLQFVQSFV